ncbi:hypothetical protein R1sor_013033 [Riccia sorocarpa]|uniref:SHSP domain-containing protein n=1 Tax=Riccia sorocarpa TaxID=122646 RepID=A0ABD3H998_9MARC
MSRTLFEQAFHSTVDKDMAVVSNTGIDWKTHDAHVSHARSGMKKVEITVQVSDDGMFTLLSITEEPQKVKIDEKDLDPVEGRASFSASPLASSRVPANTKTDEINAGKINGVLTVCLPKTEKASGIRVGSDIGMSLRVADGHVRHKITGAFGVIEFFVHIFHQRQHFIFLGRNLMDMSMNIF